FSALALHGDLEQRDRDRTLILFANRSASILVATDVAARGLDIESLDAVFNYRIAQDPEVHVHRIGRTGRAGGQGAAYTLYTPDEGMRLVRLADYVGGDIDDSPLPSASLLEKRPPAPRMATLQVDGGRKQKLRPGDILGALTGDGSIAGTQVGKIKVLERSAYVAVEREVAKEALEKLATGKLKGKSFRARRVNR
ncbi:DbpA RNA binding domain-containing protein, partial [Halomonas sp. BBD48]|nr:DbpA RNA binding domain-containing protein [Halomonas sp. BBD48]